MKNESSARRRIFVGDVQGCADELVELVARARAQFGDGFELWVAGDVVNRGPDNRRALELVRGFVGRRGMRSDLVRIKKATGPGACG